MSAADARGPMVEAQGVCKDFGALSVLKGVTLSVDRGQVLVLVGPSGSGKSTFLRCINHLEKISAGRLYVDGELIEGADMPLYLPDVEGNYTVVVVDGNGCELTSAPFFFMTNAVSSIAGLQAWTVAPNPFSEEIVLSLELDEPIQGTLLLTDRLGRTLLSRPITAVGRHQEQLSLQDLPAGLYFLHLQTPQGSAVLRIVRE